MTSKGYYINSKLKATDLKTTIFFIMTFPQQHFNRTK